MTGELLVEVRRKFYLDSVALMRHSKAIAEGDDIQEAALMMGTPANQEIMRNAGLLDADSPDAEGGDLIISIRATSSVAAASALVAANALLDQPAAERTGNAWRPRSIRSAVAHRPDANLALISVAGDFAVSEARKAIRRGLHVMIFSDNVALADEVALKNEALALGRLVMGPDCGTSIINGVPLAFANKIPRGGIGIVGASGTGIQEISTLIAAGGKGISHAIGVGGRDLSAEVGGISALMALDALDKDAGTEHIVLVSKPPAPEVAEKVFAALAKSLKPVTVCFVGGDSRISGAPANVTVVNTLKAGAESALGKALPQKTPDVGSLATNLATNPAATRRKIVGLYCGGTLCAEAQVILLSHGLALASNAPIPGVQQSDADLPADKSIHVLTDLGADEYTRGRPHPMIEPSIRDDVLIEAVSSADVAVILLDVVIGYGAHDNPASQLAETVNSIRASQRIDPVLVASVTGTDHDPQNLTRQRAILEEAGIVVVDANADGAEWAATLINSLGPQ